MQAAMNDALMAGYHLARGGWATSLDAVQATIVILEDSRAVNQCGQSARLRSHEGTNERRMRRFMDRRRRMKAGAVGGTQALKNPIRARRW